MSPTTARAVISADYDEPIQFSLIQQVPAAIVFALTPDGGTMARIGAIAMIGYWIGAALMWLRRPQTPGRFDLLFLRWGCFPLLLWARWVFELFYFKLFH